MKFHSAALQFLVASEALRFGVRAQSVVVNRTSNTNVADAGVSDVLLETPADSGGRFSGDRSSSKTGTTYHTVADAGVSDVLLETPADSGGRFSGDGSSSKTGTTYHTVADAGVSDVLLETPADSGGRFSGDGSSSKTGTTYHTVADAGVSDVLLETPANSGGRFSPSDINNLRVDSVTRGDGSSSKTGTMHHTVADAGVSDVLLETPADSGGRFSPSDINSLRVVVDSVTRGDGSSSKTGTMHQTVADAGVSDVLLETPVDSGGRFSHTVLIQRKLSKSSKKVKPPHEDVLVSFVNDTITGEIISNVEDIDHPAPPRPMISATDQVSDYGGECRASEGCTCTAKHVYKSTRDCVLIQSTSTVSKNWDPFSKASCDRSYKLTAYDCNRCQNFVQHTDSGMVGNGSNRDITNSLRLMNTFSVSGLFLGASLTSKRDWCIEITDFSEGNSIFAFDRDTSCTGRRSGGATSNNLYQFQKCKGNDRSEINAYQGHWVNIATDGQPQIETRVTASSTATEQSTVQFTENWSLSGTVKFGKASVTASYGQTMQTTSQATLAQTNGFESALICTTTCNAEDYTYIYKVKGYDSNDARTWIDVPSCQFHCTDPVKDAHHPPKCPPLYCDPTRGTCQCCTSLEWADTDASDLPTLCDGF